ncbi:MAG: hypothetical protein J6U53_06085 [Tidjanibacter sp.]|nr:hypothetical protein [Tidjanibacter sp.]
MRQKSRLIPTLITLIGIIIISLSISIKEVENLSTILLTIGIIISAFGIVKLFRPSQEMVYITTGEKVLRHIKGHKQEVKAELEETLCNGNFEALTPLISESSCAPIVSVTYTTTSGSLQIGQLLHYVPYEYEPLSEVYVHIKK